MKHSQTGIGTMVVMAIVVVIVLVSAGYFVWSSNKGSGDGSDKKTRSSSNYLRIADYKVRIPIGGELATLKLGPIKDSPYDNKDKSIAIIAPNLDAGWKCKAVSNENRATIGAISITTGEKRAGPYDPDVLKRVGKHTYGLEVADNHCAADAAAFDTTVAQFKSAFAQMESY